MRRPAMLAPLLLAAACGGPPRDPGAHALLVTVDTLRADHLSPWGEEGLETPHLDRLFAEGLVFEQAWAPAPITTPSLGSILTSRSPRNHGALNNTYDLSTLEWTLAEALQAKGYVTGAFQPTFLADKEGFRQGFDHYDAPHSGEEWRPGPEVVARALAWLDTVADDPRPWFCWVHLFEPHSPYAPPRDLESRHRPPGAGVIPDALREEVFGERRPLTDGEREIVRGLYRAEVEATDRALGPLFERVRAIGAGRPVVTLFAADHGELLHEHEQYVGHTAYLYEPMLRVPLAIHSTTGLRPGEREDFPASLLDVMPTLLGAVGGSYESPDGGLDLLSAADDGERMFVHETFAPEGIHDQQAVRFGDRVLLLGVEGRGVPDRLFDLRTDPGQVRDLAASDPEGAASLALAFERWAAEQREPASARRLDLDEATIRQLERMGYTQGDRGDDERGGDG